MARQKTGIDLYRAASEMEKAPVTTPADAPADAPAENTGTGGFLKTTGKPTAKGTGNKRDNKRDNKKRRDSGQPGRTDKSRLTDPSRKTESSRETPGSKAARLMLLLGKDEAAKVMSRLTPEEAEEVARQIAATRRVDSVEARDLLDEFGDRFSDMEVRRAKGGVEAAREILSAAFGEDKANRIITTAVPEAAPGPFDFLGDLTFNQLANLLRKENPLTLALVLAYLEPGQASRLLESMPDEDRAAVVLRMARTEKVNRDVVDTVETALREKLRLIGKDDSEEMDGRSALADILRFMDLKDEKRLLEELGETDSSLADQVKEKLFTMDSVLHLREKDLQRLLYDMDEKTIALILKGQAPEIKETITGALSSRRRIMVADEGDLMGPMPRSEVDTAVRDFLETIRQKEEEGTFIILREEEDLI